MRYDPMIALVAMTLAACTDTAIGPPVTAVSGLAPTAAWGPETPHFNLQVVLRGQGFGLVTFRQPNDADLIINLDTWVRDLTPNASRAELFRSVAAFPVGSTFDIHFQVVDATTGAVVLQSRCYEFTISL